MSKTILLNDGTSVFLSDRITMIVESAPCPVANGGELSQDEQDAMWADIAAQAEEAIAVEANFIASLGGLENCKPAIAGMKKEMLSQSPMSVDDFMAEVDGLVAKD